MKKIFLILTFQFSILHSFCQPIIQWETSLGGTIDDEGYSIFQTFDGGYIIAGLSGSNDGDVSGNHGDGDAWIVKIDQSGNILWQHCYGGTFPDQAMSIIQTSDSGYVFAGYSGSTNGDVSGNHGGPDYWVVKLNDTGSIQWSKCYGGSNQDYGASVIQTYDGGYAIVGYSYSTDDEVTNNHGNGDYWVVKLNDTGAIQWQRCYGGSGSEIAYSITQASDSGFVIIGNTNSTDGDFTGFNNCGMGIIKTDISGNIQWVQCLGSGLGTYGLSVIQTLDGGYAVGGYGGGAFGGWDYLVYKLSSTGTIQWWNSYGGSGDDLGTCIIQNPDGSYVIGGYTSSSDGEVIGHPPNCTNYWIVKLDTSGSIIWQKYYGGPNADLLNGIIRTNDGGYAMVGSVDANGGDVTGFHGGSGYDYWVVKLYPDSTTGIDKISSKNSYISIYPNPSDGNFNLDYKLPSGKGELIITDIAGRVLYRMNITGINGTQKINIADFVNGIYYWHIISGNEIPPNGKIVVLK